MKLQNTFLTGAENLVRRIPNVTKIFDVNLQNFKDYYKDKGAMPKSFTISKLSEEFAPSQFLFLSC